MLEDEDGKTSTERAERDLKMRTHAISAVYDTLGSGYRVEQRLTNNHAIAENVLNESLGDFGDYEGRRYNLSESDRDLLIAHTRQDAAQALANTIDNMRTIDRVEHRQRVSIWVAACLIVVLVLAIFADAILV